MAHVDNGTIAGISNDPGGNPDVTRAIHLANAGVQGMFHDAGAFNPSPFGFPPTDEARLDIV